ncbi:CvpA family protein [bacterium]|nr:CvpA family protein [bacterium]
MHLNLIDWILLVILLFFILRGFLRGLLVELLILAGWLVSYALAVHAYGQAGDILAHVLHPAPFVRIGLGFAAVFSLVFFFFHILARFVRGRFAGPGWLSRLGGSLIGLLKGTWMAGILAAGLAWMPSGEGGRMSRTLLLRPLCAVTKATFPLISQFTPGTKKFVKDLEQAFKQSISSVVEDPLKDQLEDFEDKIRP